MGKPIGCRGRSWSSPRRTRSSSRGPIRCRKASSTASCCGFRIGYPEREEELQVLTSHRQGEPVDQLTPVLDCQQVIALQEAVRRVTMDEAIHHYLLDLIDATRNSDDLHVGVSTRGALCFIAPAKPWRWSKNGITSFPTTSSDWPCRSWHIASSPRAICTAISAAPSKR